MTVERFNTFFRLNDKSTIKVHFKGREIYCGTYAAFLKIGLDDVADYHVDLVEESEPGVFTYWVHENE